MDFSNKFIVVECYDSDGSSFIEAAPGTWFKGNFLYWPKSQRNLRRRSVLSAQIDLDDTSEWTKSSIKSVKGFYDSFPDACKVAASLVCYDDTEEEQQNLVTVSTKRTMFRAKQQEAPVFDLEVLMASAVGDEENTSYVEEYEQNPGLKVADNFEKELLLIDLNANSSFLSNSHTFEEQNMSCRSDTGPAAEGGQVNINLPSVDELQQYLSAESAHATCK